MSALRKGLDRSAHRAAAEEGRHVIAEADDAAVILMLVALMIAARQLGHVARQRLIHRVGIHGDRRIGRTFLGGRRTGWLAFRLAMLFRLAMFPMLARGGLLLWLCRLRPFFAMCAVALGFATPTTAATTAASAAARRFIAFAEGLGLDTGNIDRRDRLAD